jgi:dTDP-4-amino-4,6-dideoxygalactose transaminase
MASSIASSTASQKPSSELALFGGPKTVTLERDDPWPVIGEQEIERVVQLMRAGIISITDGSGPIGEFEVRFADYIGAKYALMTNNGTSALHCAVFGVGVGAGDEVILPDYTWHACPGAVVAANAVPVFAECDPQTLTLDPADVERRITPRTRAIMVVHLWGNVADMEGILAVAHRHRLAVIEDCSHAHGATWLGKRVGTWGDVGVFSLQGSKVTVAGEGGILVTDNPLIFDRGLLLGNFGRIPSQAVHAEFRQYQTGFGFKYRPHPLAAAIALGQLNRLDELNRQRKANYEYLMSGLTNLPGIRLIQTLPQAERGGYYGTRLLYVPSELAHLSLGVFLRALSAEGVECDIERYNLLHLTPYYQECSQAYPNYHQVAYSGRELQPPYRAGEFPVSEDIHQRLVALPVFTKPQFELLDQYIAAFHKVIRHVEDLKDLGGT